MRIKAFNIMLAQFLFLSAACGINIYGIVLDILKRQNVTGKNAETTAVIIGLSISAIAVAVRWKLKKQFPTTNPNLLSRNNFGHALVAIGNATILLGVLPINMWADAQGGNYMVVGGIAVLIGGGITLVSWLLGASLINSSELKQK